MMDLTPEPNIAESPLSSMRIIDRDENREYLRILVEHIVEKMAGSETRKREFSILQGRDGALGLFEMDTLIQRLTEHGLWARLEDPQTLIVARRLPTVRSLDLPEVGDADPV